MVLCEWFIADTLGEAFRKVQPNEQFVEGTTGITVDEPNYDVVHKPLAAPTTPLYDSVQKPLPQQIRLPSVMKPQSGSVVYDSSAAVNNGEQWRANNGVNVQTNLNRQQPSSAHDDGGLWYESKTNSPIVAEQRVVFAQGTKDSPNNTADARQRNRALINLASQPLETPMSPAESPDNLGHFAEDVAWPARNEYDHATAVEAYMTELRSVLDLGETREFSILLRAYRHKALPLEEFLNKLMLLFGDERQYMLPGMRPFVLKSSWAKFDEFIIKHIARENLFRPAATPDIQTVTDMGAQFPSTQVQCQLNRCC